MGKSMAKQTVQGLMLERLEKIEDKLDTLLPVVEGLKVKAAIAGGIAGIIGTGVVSMLISAFK